MTSATVTPAAAAGSVAIPADRSSTATRQRGDIQGLRAVAVLLVLAYHAGLPWLPGGFVGVDVFFVISGFLITGLIVREVERTGRLRFRRFYARRIRRLLPATAIVLAATAAMTVLVLPITRWGTIALDVVASAFYVVNWRLAATSVDYLASEQAASPVQHFWSLAVEEQFYVVWPVMIGLCLVLRRRFGWPLRRTLAVGLTAVALPTLAWSAWYTAVAPAQAYFVSTTRLWELAAGAFLVLVIHRAERLPRVAVWLLGWGGLAGMAASAVIYTVQTPFPGLAALLPVLSTVAVLAAGTSAPGAGVGALLSWRPMQQIGDISYSLYLWHWPFVVAGTALFAGDDGELWWVVGALLVGTSVIPAWFTYTVVERPIHHSAFFLRSRAIIATLVVCTLVPVLAALAVQGSLAQRTSTAAAPTTSAVGAEALGDDPTRSPAGEVGEQLGPTRPDVTVVADDNADVYADGCHQDPDGTDAVGCTYGLADSPVRIALVGDSHAAQWQPALRRLAEEKGWAVDSFTKSGCGFFDLDVTVGSPPTAYTACSAWNDDVVGALLAGEYDLVVTSGSNNYAVVRGDEVVPSSESRDLVVDGYVRQWDKLADAGIRLLVLANTPWVETDIPDCLAQHSDDIAACAVDRRRAEQRAGDHQRRATERSRNVRLADLNDWICPRERCAPVIGGVIVFRDGHHLSATYARSLAPALDRELSAFDLGR